MTVSVMKATLEERFRRKLTRFGKKNRRCRLMAIPVMAAGMFLFHAAAYVKRNGKRLAMLPMTLLLFAVYSSFSFPLFISESRSDNGLNPISEEAQDIVLAEQVEIDIASIELLDDEDVLPEGDDYLRVHGEIGELYSAAEILEAAGDREAQGDTAPETAPDILPETPDGTTAEIKFSKDDWRLVLINKQHSIPDDYDVALGRIDTLKGTMYCDERIIDDYLDMLKAAQEEGVELAVTSPYRDMARQEYLFNRKITAFMKRGLSYMEAFQLASQAVTVPGASEHQIGLALDIVTPSYRNLDEGFAETEAGRWLAENSFRFGFILRYPKGKEYITGIEYEPWHFRYVGVEAATEITGRGITLEELWEEL